MVRQIPEDTRLNWMMLSVLMFALLCGIPKYSFPDESEITDIGAFCSITPALTPRLGATACEFRTVVEEGSIEFSISSLL
jgi:hypothetical protein